MIKVHKIRLHPTPEQAGYLVKVAGTARFVWSWALAEWKRHHVLHGLKRDVEALHAYNEALRQDTVGIYTLNLCALILIRVFLGYLFGFRIAPGRHIMPEFE